MKLTGVNSETGEVYNHGWCPEIDGNLNLSPCAKNNWNYGLPWKDGVYIHSCNASGHAGPTYYDGMKPGSGISVGCLLLDPLPESNKQYTIFKICEKMRIHYRK